MRARDAGGSPCPLVPDLPPLTRPQVVQSPRDTTQPPLTPALTADARLSGSASFLQESLRHGVRLPADPAAPRARPPAALDSAASVWYTESPGAGARGAEDGDAWAQWDREVAQAVEEEEQQELEALQRAGGFRDGDAIVAERRTLARTLLTGAGSAIGASPLC